VTFDPAATGLTDLIARLRRAGYDVATGEAELVIRRLSDDNDARRLEKALLKLEGVLEAHVSLAAERVWVRYVPTVVSQAETRAAVARSGFEALDLGGEAEDAEAKACQAEIRHQRRLLLVGLVFTLPLFLFSMGRDLGLLWATGRTPPGRTGSCCCWRRRFYSMWAGSITWGPSRRCATARLTWTC